MAEDDPDVRELAAGVLEDAGYAVATAPTGEAALLRLLEDGGFSVLLTDIRMPGSLDGWKLAERARVLFPSLGVVYMSGFTDLPEARAGVGPLLPKPWRPHQLIECIRLVLGRAAGSGASC